MTVSAFATRLQATPTAAALGPALLFAFLLASLAPIVFTTMPAMVDFPNHLARMSVLMKAGSAAANPFYEVAWRPYPNLAMDLIVPPIGRMIGLIPATRLFYVASQLLIVSGAMVLSFTVRRAFLGAGFTACLGLYCIPFGWGFVNFEFGVGVSLWAMAAWIALAHGALIPRMAVHGLFVVLLYTSHFFALGIYGFVVGVWELWRARAASRSLSHTIRTLAELAAPVVALAIAVALLGESAGAPAVQTQVRWEFGHKLVWLFGLNGSAQGLSYGLTGVLLLIVYAAVRNGCVRLPGPGMWLAGGFALLYLTMPFGLRDTSFVDVRVLAAAALVLPAFTLVEIHSRLWRRRALLALATVAAVNVIGTIERQLTYDREYRALIATFRDLAPRSRILVAMYSELDQPIEERLDDPLNHAPTLAVHYADAFVPSLFAYPGQQPIRARSPLVSSLPGDPPLNTSLMTGILSGRVSAPAFIRDWTHDYDYVYVLRGTGVNPIPTWLDPVAVHSSFALYRVRTLGRP